MVPYEPYETPARRQRGVHVPPLDVGATSSFVQGLMTPLSAGSLIQSPRGSTARSNWNDPGYVLQQSYSPGHHNTPVQGLADTNNFDVSGRDSMHIHIGGGLAQQHAIPTPMASTLGYRESNDMLGMSFAISPRAGTPLPLLSSSTLGLSGHLQNTDTSLDQQIFGSSLGLSGIENLKLETVSPQMTYSTTNHNYIQPEQMLHDFQYTNTIWRDGSSCSPVIDQKKFVHTPTTASQLLSPVSSMDDEYSMDSFPSPSDSQPSSHLATSPSSTPAATSHKKTPRRNTKKSDSKAERYMSDAAGAGPPIDVHVDANARAYHHQLSDSTSSTKLVIKDHPRYPCDLCSRCFKRAEHHKRHGKTHKDERDFICYWPTCKAGQIGFGRGDNASDHMFTHVKAYCVLHPGLVLRASATDHEVIVTKKGKSRNDPVGPNMMRALVMEKHPKEKEVVTRRLNFLQRKLAVEFGIHLDWTAEDVEASATRCTWGQDGLGFRRGMSAGRRASTESSRSCPTCTSIGRKR